MEEYENNIHSNMEPCNQCGTLTDSDRIVCEDCKKIFEDDAAVKDNKR